MANGDVDTAILLYLEMNNDSEINDLGSSFENVNLDGMNSSGSNNETTYIESNQYDKSSEDEDDEKIFNPNTFGPSQSIFPNVNISEMDEMNKINPVLNIRKPDTVKKMNLLGRYDTDSELWNASDRNSGDNINLEESDDPSIDWLYPQQNHISFPGNFAQVKLLFFFNF
jgi:hypothetical protein